MSVHLLPNELLAGIFFHLSASRSNLYRVALVSRTFYHIVKPILYRQITIRTKRRRELLKRARREDAQLVQKLVIDGRESGYFSRSSKNVDCKFDSGFGCLVDLFEGKLLDITTLHVLHFVGPPSIDDPPKLKANRPATNLVELSVRGHRGGGDFWDAVLLLEQNRPKLAKVGFLGVTYCHRRRGHYGVDEEGFDERPALLLRLASSVDVMVVPEFAAERIPQSHGVLVRGGTPDSIAPLWISRRGCNAYWRPFSDSAHPSHASFFLSTLRQMLEAIRPVPERSIFLFIFLPWSRSRLPSEFNSILAAMEGLSVEVHVYGLEWEERVLLKDEAEDYISLIPQVFVDWVSKQKEKETGETGEDGSKS
ncbi:F-box protein [Sporobolomyces salmoneus]|uniref:F-box protein n=1 Tax=Sporobolomyces salmoneus TaxID=183962 RepID=UPI003172F588